MTPAATLPRRLSSQRERAREAIFLAAVICGSGACIHSGSTHSAEFEGTGFASDLVPFAENVLRTTLPGYAKDLDVRPVGEIRSWPCKDDRQASFSSERDDTAVALRGVVAVEVRCADGRRAAVSQWFSMAGRVPVLVTTRAIERNERLAVSDVAVQSHALSENSYKAMRDLGDLDIPVRAIRDLRAGDVVSHAAVAQAPEVAAGETVEVVYAEGAVRIALRAKAQSDAKLGERVRVLRKAGLEPLVARVIGIGKVEIVQ